MRAMAVVVIGVLGQHRHQMPTSEDKHPVQDLTPIIWLKASLGESAARSLRLTFWHPKVTTD
jgi:hypothetical protein